MGCDRILLMVQSSLAQTLLKTWCNSKTMPSGCFGAKVHSTLPAKLSFRNLILRPSTFNPYLLPIIASLLLLGRGYSQVESDSGATTERQAILKIIEGVQKQQDLPALWAGKFYHPEHELASSNAMASVGVRKDGFAEPVSDGDLLHLGSCTKAMTAALIAQLVSQEKLRWDSTLEELFPDLSFKNEEWKSSTVAELMRHTSGAEANCEWQEIDEKFPKKAVAGRQAVLQWMIEQDRKPKKHLYSNVGYAVLGHIAETIEKKPWEELVFERILEPVGVTKVGFGPVKGDSELDQPWGHMTKEKSLGETVSAGLGSLFGNKSSHAYEPIQTDNPLPLGPAGRIHMSMENWSKFVSAFASEKPEPRWQISKEAWEQLITATAESEDYAGGWILFSRGWADGLALFHNGTNTTWYCSAWVAPKKGFCILVATNAFGDHVFTTTDQVTSRIILHDVKQR